MLRSLLRFPSVRVGTRAFRATTPNYFRIGDVAPDFKQDSTAGPIEFHKWIGGKWALFVSHPAEFTPVCTTELSELQKLVPELEKRGVKAIGLSCDRLKKHEKWVGDILDYGKLDKITYPIIADADRSVAKMYQMLDDNLKDEEGLPLTVRSVFLVDPNKKMRLILTYPASTGREWKEVIRCIDSIMLAEKFPVATPHGWKPGDEVVVSPKLTTAEAQKRFAGVKVKFPYLRFIPQPK